MGEKKLKSEMTSKIKAEKQVKVQTTSGTAKEIENAMKEVDAKTRDLDDRRNAAQLKEKAQKTDFHHYVQKELNDIKEKSEGKHKSDNKVNDIKERSNKKKGEATA